MSVNGAPIGEAAVGVSAGGAGGESALGKAEQAIDAAKQAIQEVSTAVNTAVEGLTGGLGGGLGGGAAPLAPSPVSDLPGESLGGEAPIDEVHIELDDIGGAGAGAAAGAPGAGAGSAKGPELDIPGVVEDGGLGSGNDLEKVTCNAAATKWVKVAEMAASDLKKQIAYWKSFTPPDMHGYVDAMFKTYKA